MTVNLYANNGALLRASYTAMDQTYGNVEKGDGLQAIDNGTLNPDGTRKAPQREQPFATPEGYVVVAVSEHTSADKGFGGKFVVYRNERDNTLLVSAMGTNGDGDAMGWYANATSYGIAQWRDEPEARNAVFKAIAENVDANTKIVFNGDSKGAMLAQVMTYDLVKERDKGKDGLFGTTPELSRLLAVSNDNLAIVAHSGAGITDYLKRTEGNDFDPTWSAFTGIATDYVAYRDKSSGIPDIVSMIGGDTLNGFGLTRYWETDLSSTPGTADFVPWVHRLTESGWQYLSQVAGGNVAEATWAPRTEIDVSSMAAIGAAMVGGRPGMSDDEALARTVAALAFGAASGTQDLAISMFKNGGYFVLGGGVAQGADNPFVRIAAYEIGVVYLARANLLQFRDQTLPQLTEGAKAVLMALDGYVKEVSRIGDNLIASTALAFEIVSSQVGAGLLDIGRDAADALAVVAEGLNRTMQDVGAALADFKESMAGMGVEAQEAFLNFALGLSSDVAAIPETALAALDALEEGLQSLSDQVSASGEGLAHQILDFAMGLSRAMDEAGTAVMSGVSFSAGTLRAIWQDTTPAGASLMELELGISPLTATTFTLATQAAPARRDPLTLDLDNNGLDTTGIDPANPILFDHDADDVKTATGWIKASDAFLVLDRNGNGTIDSGRELFGDATPLYAGGLAADGFAALAQEDSNADGRVDATDARFADLRLWTDLNQDGISQSNELFTLEQKSVAALIVAKTENAVVLANGNQIADLGGYLRTDGSGGVLGATEQMADIDLASNPFFSEFTDSIPLTEAAQALPDVNGAGQVRSLRQAASLDTPEGQALAAQLAAFAAQTTRESQRAQLDNLLKAWAETSTMATTATGAFAGVDLGISFADVAQGTPAYQAWLDKLTILERFNGQTFLPVPEAGTSLNINFYSTREALLEQSYAALKESVYAALVVQTRLKPYLDAIELNISEAGIALDFAPLETLFDGRHATDPDHALLDRFELIRYAGPGLVSGGWGGVATLDQWVAEAQARDCWEGLRQNLASIGPIGTPGRDSLYANGEGDVLYGAGGNDGIRGGDGLQIAIGGTGDDFLNGGAGNDKSRRWRDGKWKTLRVAANDSEFEMRSVG